MLLSGSPHGLQPVCHGEALVFLALLAFGLNSVNQSLCGSLYWKA
jgi:hypothetical protein